MAETTFADKVEILSDLWMYHRFDEEFENLIEFADLGLPLAYAKSTDLIDFKPRAVDLINETFEMLLGTLGIEEDDGYSTLYQLLGLEVDEDFEYKEEEEEEEEGDTTAVESYESGFKDGSMAEQKRVQDICQMQMTWAKQSNKGNDFMQWHNVSELLKPINFEYSEEKYYEDLRNEGF